MRWPSQSFRSRVLPADQASPSRRMGVAVAAVLADARQSFDHEGVPVL